MLKRLIFSLLFLLPIPAFADTFIADSCSRTDILNKWASVTSATTLFTIPAGSCSWTDTNTLTLTLPATGNLTIQGSTVISGTCGPVTMGGAVGTCTALDVTTITDNAATSNALIAFETKTGCSLTRITGLTFATGTGLVKQNGMVVVEGACHSTRLDNLHLAFTSSSLGHIGIRTHGIYGVVDHCLFDMPSGIHEPINIEGDTAADPQGHLPWGLDTNFGGADFLYLENIVSNNGDYTTDCTKSAKQAVRYSVLLHSRVQTHPTGSDASNASHGCRATEIYNVSFTSPSNCDGSGGGLSNCTNFATWMSSGPALIHNNFAPLISGQSYSGLTALVNLHSMRKDNGTYTQAHNPTGWSWCGTAFDGTGSVWDGNTNAGTGYPCMDQPGQGKAQVLSGNFPTLINSITGIPEWPNQALEPVYAWLSTFVTVPNNVPNGCSDPCIFQNNDPTVEVAARDYYIGTGSTSISNGVGSGIKASMPGSCANKEAYWATDEQKLYQCSGGALLFYYQPYTYPHPLISGTVPTSTDGAARGRMHR